MDILKKNNGYIVVETVGAFVPFMLLVISILSLVNIITLQARLHNALTQAAGTLSMYCYTLDAIGVADELSLISAKGEEFSDTMSDVIGGIGALTGSGGDIEDVERAFDAAQTVVGDPKEMIRNFANYGLDELRNFASAKLVEPLVLRYLTNLNETVADYFKRIRVQDFSITDCVIIDSGENIKLTAEYEIEYTFGIVRLPDAPTLRLSQTVVTKAWLGGSGPGYKFE